MFKLDWNKLKCKLGIHDYKLVSRKFIKIIDDYEAGIDRGTGEARQYSVKYKCQRDGCGKIDPISNYFVDEYMSNGQLLDIHE